MKKVVQPLGNTVDNEKKSYNRNYGINKYFHDGTKKFKCRYCSKNDIIKGASNQKHKLKV